MADILRANKKVIIPVVAVIAAAFAGLVLFSPLSVLAQQSNGTSTTNTPTVKPTINGTINIPQIIKNQIKVSFSDAAKSAADAVSGGTVVSGHLGTDQGYLVYTFTVINTSNNLVYTVIVDPGNGNVLFQSQGHVLGSWAHGFGMSGRMIMKHHGFGGMGMWNGQNNSQTPAPQSQSNLNSPGWVQTQY